MCGESMFKLFLLGSPYLVRPDGSVATLGSKPMALLAILAMSAGKPRARSTLQNMLWSDRGQYHGRDSLKKAIAGVRRALGPEGTAILRTNGGPVSLDPARLWVDALEGQSNDGSSGNAEFLEGIDIRDEQFESWLREMRVSLRGAWVPKTTDSPDLNASKRISIAIQPVSRIKSDGLASLLPELLLDQIIDALTNTELFDVYDYRDNPLTDRTPCDLVMQTRAMSVDGTVHLSFAVRRNTDSSVLWSNSTFLTSQDIYDAPFGAMVARTTDQICDLVLRRGLFDRDERYSAAFAAMNGIDRMFRLSNDNLLESANYLSRAIHIEPRSTYFAWYAYLTAFRLEASKGADLLELRELSDGIAQQALELDSRNPLVRSLLAHVYSFVFRDFNKSGELLEPLAVQQIRSPMYYHSAAMLNFYKGKYSRANRNARLAMALGSTHPFAYAFATSLCMIDLMNGDFATAASHGEKALARHQPGMSVYGPTMRYLVAAHALSGNKERASQIWSSMSESSSECALQALEDKRFPVPTEEARRVLRSAFESMRSIN